MLTVYLLLSKNSNAQKLLIFEIPNIDKLLHLLIFALFDFLWIITPLFKNKFKFNVRIVFISTLSLMFSIVLEFLQLYTNFRKFDVFDICFNFIGIGLIMIVLVFSKKSKKKLI